MKKTLSFLLLLLILLAACRQVAPTPTATVIASPTPLPSATPTITVHKEAVPTYDPYGGYQQSSGSGGTQSPSKPQELVYIDNKAYFQDNLAVADQVAARLTNVNLPPGGKVYQAWLLAEDDSFLNLGVLEVKADGSIELLWNSPAGKNLYAGFSRFRVTVEPEPGSSTPGGNTAFAGEWEPGWKSILQSLFVSNQSATTTPLDTPFAVGLLSQTDLAVQHVHNAINAAAIGADGEMRTHLEHTINILEGSSRPRFKDYTGDGAAQNPGDGFGAIIYAQQIGVLAGTMALQEASRQFEIAATAVEDKCIQILETTDRAQVKTLLDELESLAQELRNGPAASLYRLVQMTYSMNISPTR